MAGIRDGESGAETPTPTDIIFKILWRSRGTALKEKCSGQFARLAYAYLPPLLPDDRQLLTGVPTRILFS